MRGRLRRDRVWSLLFLCLCFASDSTAQTTGLLLQNGSAKNGYQQHFRNLRTTLLLARNGYEVLWVSRSAEIKVADQTKMAHRSDYLIHTAGQAKSVGHWRQLKRFVKHRTKREPLTLNASAEIYGLPIESPRILVDAQPWSGNYNWYYDTLTLGGFTFRHMFDHRKLAPDPRFFNVLVAPGGGGEIPPKYNDLLRGFVAHGGHYVGSCWGAAQAIYPSRVGYGTGNGASIADAYNNEVVRSFGAIGGVGVIRLRNTQPNHPVMWGLPNVLTNIYWNGPVMRVGPNAKVLATLSGVDTTSFQFHSRSKSKRKQDADEERGKALYVVSQRKGEGKVILFGNHPEASSSINPFPAFQMGSHATFNAMLFAVAKKETRWQRTTPLNRRLTKRQLANRSQKSVQLASLSKQISLAEKLSTNVHKGTNFDEDQPAGCYLLRATRELRVIAKRQSELTSLQQQASPALRARIRRWRFVTEQTMRTFREKLKKTRPRRMNRWNSWWQPIVGPVFERAQELRQLIDDCELYAALRRLK